MGLIGDDRMDEIAAAYEKSRRTKDPEDWEYLMDLLDHALAVARMNYVALPDNLPTRG
jgi:hypothetical protein